MAWRRVAGSLVSSCPPSVASRALGRGHSMGPSQLSARALPRCLRTGAGAVRGLAGGKVKMVWSFQGEKIDVEAEEGKTLLEVAHANDIELEGACGGELACSTCHVVFAPDVYEALPEKEEEEDDMLDLAWGLTDTSRLGCQIKVSPVLEGALITIPEETNNLMDPPPTGAGSKP